MKTWITKPARSEHTGGVYCPLCTRSVEAQILSIGRTCYVKPGQKCSRCGGSLDAGYVLGYDRAA